MARTAEYIDGHANTLEQFRDAAGLQQSWDQRPGPDGRDPGWLSRGKAETAEQG